MSDNKKFRPRAVLCYSSADDWLAGGIADAISDKEFYLPLDTVCVNGSDDLKQIISEGDDGHTCFIVLLTPCSIEKLWIGLGIDDNRILEMRNTGRLLPVVHRLTADDWPVEKISKILFETALEMRERCDVTQLVAYIQSFGDKAPPVHADELIGHTKICDISEEVQHISFYLGPSSGFKSEIAQIRKGYKGSEDRLQSALRWLEERGLAKIDGEVVQGVQPSINCFVHIKFMNTIRSCGIAENISILWQDTLILKRERFEGKIFNDEGSLDIRLVASADRSGRIKLEVEPKPNSLDTMKELEFAYCKTVDLKCVSTVNKARKLTSENLLVRCDIKEDPVPMWFEGLDKVVITDKAEEHKDKVNMTICLSELDIVPNYKFGNVITAPPKAENLGFVHISGSAAQTLKNRSNKRITANLSIVNSVKEAPNNWEGEVSKLASRIITVLGFAQGGGLYCPITEIIKDGSIETVFLCKGESAPQFMPVIQRGEDLDQLIKGVIKKNQEFNDEQWEVLQRAIGFFLSSQLFNGISLLSNLAAIETLVKVFGDKSREGCKSASKIEFFLQDRDIFSNGIESDDVRQMVDNRNDLAHEAKLSTENIAGAFATSYEIFIRIVISLLDFKGWYCTYHRCEKGIRSFPKCEEVKEASVGSIAFLLKQQKWQATAKGEVSPFSTHLPSK